MRYQVGGSKRLTGLSHTHLKAHYAAGAVSSGHPSAVQLCSPAVGSAVVKAAHWTMSMSMSLIRGCSRQLTSAPDLVRGHTLTDAYKRCGHLWSQSLLKAENINLRRIDSRSQLGSVILLTPKDTKTEEKQVDMETSGQVPPLTSLWWLDWCDSWRGGVFRLISGGELELLKEGI